MPKGSQIFTQRQDARGFINAILAGLTVTAIGFITSYWL